MITKKLTGSPLSAEVTYRHRIGVVTLIALILFGCSPGSDSAPTVLIPNHGSGSVRVRLVFGAGSAYDPGGQEGLAQFTARALERGTGSYTSSEMAATLDRLAAQIVVEVDRDVAIIEGVCPTASWSEFADLFLSVLTEPSFDEQELASLKWDQLDAIDQLRRDDEELAKSALQFYIYRDHSYGHPPEGLTHTVESFTADDVRSFFTNHYTRENYSLGLTGDVSDTLAMSIRRGLSTALPSGAPRRPELPAVVSEGTHLYLIEKKNRTQTQLRFGRAIDITRSDPDFMPLYLVNTHLGGHRDSSGQLYQIICASRGLSNGACSYAEHFDQDSRSNLARTGRPRQQQYFSAWVSPRSENTSFAIHLVMKTLANIREYGITESQLDAARDLEIYHFPTEIETPGRLLGMRMDEICLSTRVFVDSFVTRAKSVTVDDAKRAIARAIDPANMVIVAVVSDGEAFAEELIRGQVAYQYPLGVDPRSLRERDREYLNYQLPISGVNIRVVKADEIFR